MITQTLAKPHRTKEEYVYATLRSGIMRCDLRPGEKLVLETISSELGVSPIPVRSAFQRLQAEGLVEITPHTGTTISTISPDTVNEIFMILESLEQVAFSVVAEKATSRNITDLRQLIAQMEQVLQGKDADQWYDLNNQFHLSIATLTEMKMLLRFTSRALDNRDRLRYFYSEQFAIPRMSEAHAEHSRMVDLLESREIEPLKKLVTQHNQKAKNAYNQLIERQTQQQNGSS